MLDTLAQIVSNVLLGLGNPPNEWLRPEEALDAVMERLALRLTILAQSNQNQIIKHLDFTPSTRDRIMSEADVTMATPAWVERMIGTVPYEIYDYVPTCNLNILDDARAEGLMRCAFYTEDDQPHIRFSYNPQDFSYRKHRLWYDPNPVLISSLGNTSKLPPQFSFLITEGAKVRAGARMMANAAAQATEENPLSPALIKAWEQLLKVSAQNEAEWENRYKHFVFESRGSERGRARRPVLDHGHSVQRTYRG